MRKNRSASSLIVGFTLVELLVILSIIGLLASLLLPALNKAKDKAATIGCLNNLKQLETCWQAYTLDNKGILAPNTSRTDGTENATNTNETLPAGPATSWVSDHPRRDLTADGIQNGLLYPYNMDVSLYHCPADWAKVESAADNKPLKQTRLRSYTLSQSMNGWTLTFDPIQDNIPVYTNISTIAAPAQKFVFIDEHEDTMTDGTFSNPVGLPFWPVSWFDLPANRHNQGACLSFADGHAERWRWDVPKVYLHFVQSPHPEEIKDFQRVQSAMKTLEDRDRE